jgi:hypothetical protein
LIQAGRGLERHQRVPNEKRQGQKVEEVRLRATTTDTQEALLITVSNRTAQTDVSDDRLPAQTLSRYDRALPAHPSRVPDSVGKPIHERGLLPFYRRKACPGLTIQCHQMRYVLPSVLVGLQAGRVAAVVGIGVAIIGPKSSHASMELNLGVLPTDRGSFGLPGPNARTRSFGP